MFVVLGMVQWFSALGGPMRWSLAWYGAMLLLAGLLGAITAQCFSEPLNRRLRQELVNLPPVHISAM
jgi:peptidoglycan/LPS O-acetylase OafA/YrhL